MHQSLVLPFSWLPLAQGPQQQAVCLASRKSVRTVAVGNHPFAQLLARLLTKGEEIALIGSRSCALQAKSLDEILLSRYFLNLEELNWGISSFEARSLGFQPIIQNWILPQRGFRPVSPRDTIATLSSTAVNMERACWDRYSGCLCTLCFARFVKAVSWSRYGRWICARSQTLEEYVELVIPGIAIGQFIQVTDWVRDIRIVQSVKSRPTMLTQVCSSQYRII